MRYRTGSWVCMCALVVLTGGCSGCNGGGFAAQQQPFTLDFLGPLGPIQVGAGQVVTITYADEDPIDLATTSFFADQDGDLTTTADQIVIALSRPEGDGATQTLQWDTTGVPPGTYRIIAVMTDGTTTITFEAPGRATVTGPNVAPTLSVTGPDQPLTLSRGACVPVSYVDDDPDDVALTSLVADVDGDLSTAGDATDIELGRPEMDGQPQSLFWDSSNVPEGTYFIGGTTDDGVNAPVSDVAPGQVTLENMAYAKRAGGIPFQAGSAVAAFTDGSCVVTGTYDTTFGPVTFGPGETGAVTFNTGTGTFVARYQADGSLAFARRADGGTPAGIASFADGSCVVTGGFFGTMTVAPGESNEVTLTNGGGQDLFLAKYDANGALAWALRVGSARTDRGTHVASLANGSFLVAGEFRDSVVFGAGDANETTLTAASSAAFVARFNPDGSLAWARSPALTNPRGLAAFPDDSYALLTQGNTIHRFNADGSLAWTRTITDIRANAISGFADGSLVVGGGFSVPVTFGLGEANQTALAPVGQADLFVARFNPDGTLAWASAAGGTQASLSFESIASLAGGGCVLGGAFFGSPTFGAGEANETTLQATPLVFNTSISSQDSFVAAYRADGTLAFARGVGGGADDNTLGVAGFPDCSFVATGMFAGPDVVFGEGDARETTLSDPAPAPDGVDMFVARYNADGGY